MKEIKNTEIVSSEEDLEFVAGGNNRFSHYTKRYPVKTEEARYIRDQARKCRQRGMSYGEYRRFMWSETKATIDRMRREKYKDHIFCAGDPLNDYAQDLEGMHFNNIIDEFWVEMGGTVNPAEF